MLTAHYSIIIAFHSLWAKTCSFAEHHMVFNGKERPNPETVVANLWRQPALCQTAQWNNASFFFFFFTSSLTTESLIWYLRWERSKLWGKLSFVAHSMWTPSYTASQNVWDFEHAPHVWWGLWKANRTQLFWYFMQLVFSILCACLLWTSVR